MRGQHKIVDSSASTRSFVEFPRPFLKWAGGKRQVLDELIKSLPVDMSCFYEPFLGGGAFFFGLLPKRAVLSDINGELIDTFVAVRDHVDDLIEKLKEHKYEREYYYAVREVDPCGLSLIERAARMIFLNKSGFNGLYRVNSKDKFNVPFGRYKNPTICDEKNLRACSFALKDVKVQLASFESVLDFAMPGDFVYFDPPYVPVSDTSYFVAYQRRGFGMDKQEKLAEVFEELTSRRINAMLSNSDATWVHERYARHNIRVIMARRQVNCDKTRRGLVGEVVVTNY
jgi:DNA adenine methylase